MSYLVCCVDGCLVRNGQGVPLHRFPNPEQNIDRFQQWVQNVQSGICNLADTFIHKNRRVCNRHFESKYHYPNNKLCRFAVPRLHLPVVPAVHVEPQERIAMDLHIATSGSALVAPQDEGPVAAMVVNEPSPPVELDTTHITRSGVRKEMAFKKCVSTLKAKLRRTKNLKSAYKVRLLLAQKTLKSGAFDILNTKLTPAAQTFIKMQFKLAGKNKKGRRFTLSEKIMALSLYKPSPKAYRLLSEICILPKRKTLQKLLQKVKLNPGINEKMFIDLKKRVSRMPKQHRYCTLVFDEMAISAGLSYNKKEDLITGFTDNGEKRTQKFADHVLVFMVRGVVKKFKQPIGYSFCSSTTNTIDLKNLIKKMIQEVHICGLKVIATVCDQGATNVAAINSLMADTKAKYLRRNEVWRGGFFEMGSKKIYPIFDPPHLMKGIRNNLLNKNLQYKCEGKICEAKWDHIIGLYKRGTGFKGMRLVPKLTAHHVMPNLIPKMKVKHSTQVFSRSVCVAMGFMADAGKLPIEANETASILLFFDKLFDSVNGSFHKIKGGKIYRAAVRPGSPHHRLWRESIAALKEMKYIDNQGRSVVVPSLSSWVKTLESFQKVAWELNKVGVDSLLLRHFNQDPLENFFGAIRAHGQSNIMPNASAFQGAFKTLMINNITSTHSVGANCEEDKASCLHTLQYFFNEGEGEPQEETVAGEHVINEEDIVIENIDTDNFIGSENVVDVERCAAIGYCSGWLVKVAKSQLTKGCITCKTALESDTMSDFHKYIKTADYSDKGWLCYPTREVFDIFCQIENICLKILTKNCEKKYIGNYIKLIVTLNLNFKFIDCKQHKTKLINFIINKTVLFCINNWCKEVNGILSGKEILFDSTDSIKLSAYNHNKKNKTRKRKRLTGVLVGV